MISGKNMESFRSHDINMTYFEENKESTTPDFNTITQGQQHKKIHLLEMQTFNAILNDILRDQLSAKHLLPSLGIDGYKVHFYQDIKMSILTPLHDTMILMKFL